MSDAALMRPGDQPKIIHISTVIFAIKSIKSRVNYCLQLGFNRGRVLLSIKSLGN